MKKATTAERLNFYMQEFDVKQVDILNRAKPFTLKYGVKLNKNDLSQYTSGKVEPGQEKLFILSKALGVSPSWLMGLDVPMHERFSQIETHSIQVPLVGTIAAGTPILAQENIENYFNIDSSISADFALRVKGDSMIKANINNGDIVFIRQQCNVENREIAAVLVDGEATLKRVLKIGNNVTLLPENDDYDPILLDENNDVRILGKMVASLKTYN